MGGRVRGRGRTSEFLDAVEGLRKKRIRVVVVVVVVELRRARTTRTLAAVGRIGVSVGRLSHQLLHAG